MSAKAPSHLIGIQAFHVRSANQTRARHLMDRTTELWRQELATVAEHVFDAHCPPSRRWRIERMELSLGQLSEADFDLQLPRRFREALEAELRRLATTAGGGGGIAEPGGGWLDVLEHLLLHGFLPWWAQVENNFDPAEALTAALARHPSLIAALARKIGRHRGVRVRLVEWLDDASLARLVRALAPADAEFILAYAADLQSRHEERPFVSATHEEFRRAKWETILAHLLADRGSRFNAKAFLRGTLHDLAAHFLVDYAELLRELVYSARRVGIEWRDSSLPQLLEELWSEDVVPPESSPLELGEALAQGADAGTSPPGIESDWAAWQRFTRAERIELTRSLYEALPPARRAVFVGRIPDSSARRELSALIEELRRASELRPVADEFWSNIVRHRLGVGADLCAALGSTLPSESAVPPDLVAWHQLSPDIRAAVSVRSTGRDPVDVAGVGVVPESPTTERPPGDEAILPSLRAFLLTGIVPPANAWRVFENTGQRPSSLLGWLELVLVRYADILPPLLRQWAKEAPLSGALPSRFADEPMHSLVAVVEPDHAVEIVEFVATARRGEPPLQGANPTSESFRCATWTVVFDYLLSDRGSVFNQRSFLAYTVEHLAVRQGIETNSLLEYLLAAASDTGRHQLFQDLRAIADARHSDAGWPSERDLDILSEAKAIAELSGDDFSPARLRRSRVLAMWALRLLLENLLPSRVTKDGQWSELVGQVLSDELARPFVTQVLLAVTNVSQAALSRLLQADFQPVLGAIVFRGEPTLFARWQEALARCVELPTLRRLVGHEAAFRARAWRALLAHWRRGGGRRVRDLDSWLATWLADDLGVMLEIEPPATSVAAVGGASREIKSDRQSPAASVADEPIAIANAGLVLLAPFFVELHRRAGLLDGPVFRNFEATHTAVHLLQFLVTAGKRSHEYTLVLNKLLCGLDVTSPVVSAVELTPPMLESANGLLENVARQWPRGAKLSVDGLRSSYLVRPGRLKRVEKAAWSLKVETRGWDILLPELPWSFGRIHSPWMSGPLTVEWI